MATKKIVVVFDAAEELGESVVRALSSSEEFQVRALTSNLQSGHENSVVNDNLDLVSCDLSDRASLQTAFRDANACFINTVTNFQDPECLQSEIVQGCLIADICKSENIHHVIFSSQLDSNKICSIMARHLVSKAEIEQYMRQIGLPLTCLIMPVFYEDLCGILKPRTEDGLNYHLEIPMGLTPLDTMGVQDVGPVVLATLRHRDAHLFKTVSVCGDKLTVREMAQILSNHLRPKIFRDKQLTAHDFHQRRSCDFEGSADWANMFRFFQRVDQRHSISVTKQMNPGLLSFENWVKANVSKLNSVL